MNIIKDIEKNMQNKLNKKEMLKKINIKQKKNKQNKNLILRVGIFLHSVLNVKHIL